MSPGRGSRDVGDRAQRDAGLVVGGVEGPRHHGIGGGPRVGSRPPWRGAADAISEPQRVAPPGAHGEARPLHLDAQLPPLADGPCPPGGRSPRR